MEKSEIIAGNETIAKFMGATRHEHNEGRPYVTWTLPGDLSHYHPNHLQYHERWDWLMHAVKKINESSYTHPYKELFKGSVLLHLFTIDITKVWERVVAFLNYNPE